MPFLDYLISTGCVSKASSSMGDDEKEDLIVTSGYSSNVLAFSSKSWKKSSLTYEGDNMSFMITHPHLKGVVYAVHEHEIGQISRWLYDHEKNQLEKSQVSSICQWNFKK